MSKGGGDYSNIASAEDYSFADPTGQYQTALNRFGGSANDYSNQMMGRMANYGNVAAYGRTGMEAAADPNAAYNAFLGQAPGLTNMAMGPNAALTQNLNAIAARQAEEGMQGVATQFNNAGAGRSGAAQAAMGEAYAQPFADVAAQQQQNALNLTGNLWQQQLGNLGSLQGQTLGTYGNIYQQGNALQQADAQMLAELAGLNTQMYGNMASQMGGMVAPQYQYNPTGWERFMGGMNDLTSLGSNAANTYATVASV
jgi:hypothetical protein